MDECFKIKSIECKEQDLNKIGFDKTYIKQGLLRHKFFTIKIYDVSCAQANIIKQTALTVGTDCAVHREVITAKIDKSDCILSGSAAQLYKFSEKLKYQPFRLGILADQLRSFISSYPRETYIRDIKIEWGKRPYIMGILNITPDSFSDGGEYFDIDSALRHYMDMLNDGVDIVDIGGESTRPYSQRVLPEEELSRVIPVIKKIREFDKNTIISIDTRNAITAKEAICSGADIINDVSALDWDNEMIDVVKNTNVPIILNHSKGSPDVMQDDTNYADVVDEIYDYFYEKIKFLISNGVDKNRIIIDPGIGFGKSTEQNFEIIKRIEEFKSFGLPVLVGHSRKHFLSESICDDNIDGLDIATLAISQCLLDKKVDIIRIHNTKQHSILKKINRLLV